MANSRIIITFTGEPLVGDTFAINWRETNNPTNVGGYFALWRAEYPRTGYGIISVRTTVGTPGEESSNEYAKSVAIDTYGIFKINANGDAVVILEFANPGFEFYAFNDTSGFINAVIENEVPSSTFELVDVTEAATGTPCVNVELTITATEPIKSTKINGTTFTGTASTVQVIGVQRGILNTVSIIDLNDVEIPAITKKWDLLDVNDLRIGVIQSLAGATVSANLTKTTNLSLEYSLDGTNYQSSNVFTGQAVGNGYTLYVRDQFGCVISKNYDVTALGSRDPFIFISQANGLCFSKVVDLDSCTNKPNYTNTLAFEDKVFLPSCAEHLMQKCDSTTIQFKSNYATPTAFLRYQDGGTTPLTLEQKTSNLQRYERMDATWFAYNSVKTGIYFQSGNLYNDTGAISGTYALDGNLPDFAIRGQYVSIIGDGTFEIIDTLYDRNKNAKIIVINRAHTGGDVNGQVFSIYDLLPYEVYEFDIDWSLHTNGHYDILIQNDDADNGTVQHISENIWLQDEHYETVSIKYWNDNNRDIFYKFGIQHFIRARYLGVVSDPKQESEINIGDNNSVVVTSSVNNLDVFEFDEITKPEMERLVIGLSCDNVYIDDIGYIKDGDIKVENLQNTNLYKVEAKMLRTGYNYNNLTFGDTGVDYGYREFNIPPIIGDNLGNLIKG